MEILTFVRRPSRRQVVEMAIGGVCVLGGEALAFGVRHGPFGYATLVATFALAMGGGVAMLTETVRSLLAEMATDLSKGRSVLLSLISLGLLWDLAGVSGIPRRDEGQAQTLAGLAAGGGLVWLYEVARFVQRRLGVAR